MHASNEEGNISPLAGLTGHATIARFPQCFPKFQGYLMFIGSPLVRLLTLDVYVEDEGRARKMSLCQ